MIRRIRSYFSKKQEDYAVERVDKTVSLMAKDIYHLKRWAMYIHDKQEHSHNTAYGKIELSRREVDKASSLAASLDAEIKTLKRYLSEVTKYLGEMHNNHIDLAERIGKLEEGQQRTIERTTQGQQRTIEEKQQPLTEEIEEVKVIEKGALNEGHKELLKIFYQSTEPLDYPTIARILRKREKSIRNMIYELRSRGYAIKDRHIGFRKKGFYIDREEKVRLSGR